jgi:hypothetical protein
MYLPSQQDPKNKVDHNFQLKKSNYPSKCNKIQTRKIQVNHMRSLGESFSFGSLVYESSQQNKTFPW